MALLLAVTLAACSGPPTTRDSDILALSQAIRALGPDVSAQEADRAARVVYAHTAQLARTYQITDPPLIHNTKVNMGLKPRGLCWHWAEDIETRLAQERFKTLDLHRAIANADNPMRIDHSTAIISAHGDPMDKGIVLDGWRHGGRLFWAPVAEDTHYKWQPQQQVLAKKRAALEKSAAR